MDFKFETNVKGHLKQRETTEREFKANFQFKNMPMYARSFAGMANNKGGMIIFGIRDKPHIPDGMQNGLWEAVDDAKINQGNQEYFSPTIQWEKGTFHHEGKEFGYFQIFEAKKKPIVCKKSNGDKLREGAIYFRYQAETKEILYSDLEEILEQERKKERDNWMNLVQKIGAVGPENIQLLDTYRGEILAGNERILIDKSVLETLSFIKEGNFTEKHGEGQPTLRLVGTIDRVVDIENAMPQDVTHPYFTKSLAEKLRITPYEVQSLVWKMNLKGNPKYHISSKSSNTSDVQKYSEAAFDAISAAMASNVEFLSSSKVEYNKSKLKPSRPIQRASVFEQLQNKA
jgi:Putative DNA-binding domain